MKRILAVTFVAVSACVFAKGGGGGGGHASASGHSSAHATESAHVSETAHISEPSVHVPTRPVMTTTYPWWAFGHAHTSTTQVQCDPKKDKDCK